MNPDELISQLSEKHKIPEGDVKEIFEGKLEECEEAGMKGDQAKKRAMERTWNEFKRRDMSSSTGVEGVILGMGDRYDAVGYSRSDAIEAYEDNPQGAIKSGKVALAVPPEETGSITGSGVVSVGEKNGWAIITHENNEGLLEYPFAERDSAETDDANTEVEDGEWRVYPLDDRRTYGNGEENNHYGMPTDKHDWTRRGIGVFRTGDDDEVRVGNLTLKGNKSAQTPPLGQALQFQARVDVDDSTGELYINSVSDTEFEPHPELDEQLPSADSLIEKYLDDYHYDLDGVFSYLSDKNGSETVVVDGDVVDMNLESNSNGTFRMVIGQFSFAGGEMKEREATVWVPDWQEEYIDFAVESRVFIIGRARLKDAYDPVKGETTSEEQEVVINAQGIYADPTSKIPRDDGAEDLDEEDLDFEPEEEEMSAEFDGGGDNW